MNLLQRFVLQCQKPSKLTGRLVVVFILYVIIVIIGMMGLWSFLDEISWTHSATRIDDALQRNWDSIHKVGFLTKMEENLPLVGSVPVIGTLVITLDKHLYSFEGLVSVRNQQRDDLVRTTCAFVFIFVFLFLFVIPVMICLFVIDFTRRDKRRKKSEE